MYFSNRNQVGQILSDRLQAVNWDENILVSLPGSSALIAWEIARRNNVRLYIIAKSETIDCHSPEAAAKSIKYYDAYCLTQQETIKSAIFIADGLVDTDKAKFAKQHLKEMGIEHIEFVTPIVSEKICQDLSNTFSNLVYLYKTTQPASIGQFYKEYQDFNHAFIAKVIGDYSWNHRDKYIKVRIPIDGQNLNGELMIPQKAKGTVVFVNMGQNSRIEMQERIIGSALNRFGFATLHVGLSLPEDPVISENSKHSPIMNFRLQKVTEWIFRGEFLSKLPMAYFCEGDANRLALEVAAKAPGLASVVCLNASAGAPGNFYEDLEVPVLFILSVKNSSLLKINESLCDLFKYGKFINLASDNGIINQFSKIDEVIEYTGEWFSKSLNPLSFALTIEPQKMTIQSVANLAHPITTDESLNPLLRDLSKAKIVLLGSSTHGTEEFYWLRKILSQRLIEEHGFNFIAVEGDWPECHRLNQYIQGQFGDSAQAVMKSSRRWPTWLWSNYQTAELVEWLKDRKIGFYGLDLYSLFESLDLIKHYLKNLSPGFMKQINDSYACIDYYRPNEISFSKSLLKWPLACEKSLNNNLKDLLKLRIQQTTLNGQELFSLQQIARTLLNAEKYYRTLHSGTSEAWNIRETHMIDTLASLLNQYGANSKAIVWTHNHHAGDYHATDMLKDGYLSLGGLARETFGPDKVELVGMGTYSGEVLSSQAWDSEAEVLTLPPSTSGTFEYYLHQVSKKISSPQFYFRTKNESSLRSSKKSRSVGVINRYLESNSEQHLISSTLAHQFDSYIFIDETKALTAFTNTFSKNHLPETWPMGF